VVADASSQDIHSPSCSEAEQATKQVKLEHVSDDIMVKPLKKATGFADLPPELHLMIWEIAMDLPPSIISVGVNLKINHGQPKPDRETHISKPETNQFNRWHWAQKMAAEFLYAKRATEKMFGTVKECRANPLTSVRPDKDIVLYVFKGTWYKNYSWYWSMDKKHNHRYMSPGIEHVGILWDRFKNNGLWCSNEVHNWGGNVKMCPGELAHFIDHCGSVKHVYIHALIRLSDTTCRKKSAMIAKMNNLIGTFWSTKHVCSY
jgi:2EXR family protein